jgi:hypothetical protein
MALARGLLSFLALIAAGICAFPAIVTLRRPFVDVAKSVMQSGLNEETYKAAAELCLGSKGAAVGWLTLAALMLANFALLRIWGAVAKL